MLVSRGPQALNTDGVKSARLDVTETMKADRPFKYKSLLLEAVYFNRNFLIVKQASKEHT